ncbi:MAG: tetratricopeptide repeat protein [Candidatus Anammoximicrobium sp.]|nr:tetratricopeptide repeat protein [Candidatus Anammoximicrobium sp.]
MPQIACRVSSSGCPARFLTLTWPTRGSAPNVSRGDKWEKSLASVYLQAGEKRKLGDSTRRLAGFEAAVRLAPQDVDWKSTLAKLLLRAGRREQAAQVLEELLAQVPQPEACQAVAETSGTARRGRV